VHSARGGSMESCWDFASSACWPRRWVAAASGRSFHNVIRILPFQVVICWRSVKSRAGRGRARDVREWLLTFPFPPIPIYSIPILSRPIPNFLTQSHSRGIPDCVIPIPSRSHSHTRSGTVVYDYGTVHFCTVRVLHHHRYSTEILIIYYHCTV